MSVTVPETWPLGYSLDCPTCGELHEVDEVDLADPAAHPYDYPPIGRMFNFECPHCHTQNGVAFSETVAPAAHQPSTEPPLSAPAPVPALPLSGEATNEEPYEDGAHS